MEAAADVLRHRRPGRHGTAEDHVVIADHDGPDCNDRHVAPRRNGKGEGEWIIDMPRKADLRAGQGYIGCYGRLFQRPVQ
jgi:hypothetical protein